MHFIEFIRRLPPQEDKAGKRFISWAKADKNFPVISDPAELGQYLYDKLDWDLTLAFQKLFMLYYSVEPNHRVPEKFTDPDKILAGINEIVRLKNKAGHNPNIPKQEENKKPGGRTINLSLTEEQYKTLMHWAMTGQMIHLHNENNDNRFAAALDFTSEILKPGLAIPGFAEQDPMGITLTDAEHKKLEDKISMFVQMAIEEIALAELAKGKKKKK